MLHALAKMAEQCVEERVALHLRETIHMYKGVWQEQLAKYSVVLARLVRLWTVTQPVR